MAPADAHLAPTALRRQLLTTLQEMAAAPLQLRERSRRASKLAAACGDEGMWAAFCSVRSLRPPRHWRVSQLCGMHARAVVPVSTRRCRY